MNPDMRLPCYGSVRDRQPVRVAWLALSFNGWAGRACFYLALSLSVSADPLLMPLDDTYIHFQYARAVGARPSDGL